MQLTINAQFWQEFDRRIDEKLEQKLDEKLGQRLKPIEEKLDMVYEQTITSMGDIAVMKFEILQIKDTLEDHGRRLDEHDTKLDRILKLLPGMNDHIYGLDSRVKKLESSP